MIIRYLDPQGSGGGGGVRANVSCLEHTVASKGSPKKNGAHTVYTESARPRQTDCQNGSESQQTLPAMAKG